MADTRRFHTSERDLSRWHTVLIVDDDPQTLVALRRLLEREPYDVVTTDRPGLALEWLTNKNVSLVLSDQRMPEMAGDRLLEEVWKRSPATRRILLTAFPERVEKIPASRRSLLTLVTKPWNDHDLKETIRSLLQDREISDQGDLEAEMPRE